MKNQSKVDFNAFVLTNIFRKKMGKKSKDPKQYFLVIDDFAKINSEKP